MPTIAGTGPPWAPTTDVWGRRSAGPPGDLLLKGRRSPGGGCRSIRNVAESVAGRQGPHLEREGQDPIRAGPVWRRLRVGPLAAAEVQKRPSSPRTLFPATSRCPLGTTRL